MLGIQKRTTLLFGLGNHCWPQSRFSAGLFAVTKYGERHDFCWKSNPVLQADIARSPTMPYLIIARPTCYLEDACGIVVTKTVEHLKVDPEDVTIAHHDALMPAGAWKEEIGTGPRENLALRLVMNALGTTMLRRFVIGVGKDPKDIIDLPNFAKREEWEPKVLQIFLRNKMVPAEWRLLEKAVRDLSDYWDGPGFEEYRKTHIPPTQQGEASSSTPTTPPPTSTSTTTTSSLSK